MPSDDLDWRALAFGPAYFQGVKWGAGVSMIFTGIFARKAHKRVLATVKSLGHKDVTPWTVEPYTMALAYAMYVTTVMKFTKFFLAQGRHNEFLYDEMVTKEFLEANPNSPEAEGLRAMMEMRQMAKTKEEEIQIQLQFKSANSDIVVPSPYSISKEEDEFKKKAKVKREVIPTFWDGVAVGVFGSVQDAYNPCKPIWQFMNMRGGVF
eukprot:PhF_6_TR19129/c0_g1_i2/m.28138